METTLRLAASFAIGYLLGSISFAVVLSKLFSKKDVRNFGSGNAGATNVARVLGIWYGLLTLLFDGLKTAAAMFLGHLIGGENGFLIAGGACLLGHCFPVFFEFRGGKGVAVGAVMGLMLSWKLFLLLCVVFFVVFAIFQRVSLSSIACCVAFPIFEYVLGFHGFWEMTLGIVAAARVIFMHRENIKRLIAGTEPKFKIKKEKK